MHAHCYYSFNVSKTLSFYGLALSLLSKNIFFILILKSILNLGSKPFYASPPRQLVGSSNFPTNGTQFPKGENIDNKRSSLYFECTCNRKSVVVSAALSLGNKPHSCFKIMKANLKIKDGP